MTKDIKKVDPAQMRLDLFELDTLKDKNYSNTLEILDVSGLFSSDRRTKYLPQASANQLVARRTNNYKELEISYTISAANIERETNGKRERVFVFPGVREETLWEVCKKISTMEGRSEPYQMEGNGGSGRKLVGLKLSLYEIRQECIRLGKTYSYEEIREGLNVLNKANLQIESDNGDISLDGTYFPVLAMADKADPDNTKMFICFHPMVTDVIYALNFRRYNYVEGMKFSSFYTRTIYKRLCHRWVQASVSNPYTIKLSTLVKSMKKPAATVARDKQTFEACLKELVDAGVLEKYAMIPRKEGRKTLDWTFDLYATDSFAKQMASNNKVKNNISGPREQTIPETTE
ncbi:MAG: RepB family plasmid replication initiator protein [Oleiphilus sp.]|nr:MAG: RepB family plasmid replication initiator protein [Oleiphilus sp.]